MIAEAYKEEQAYLKDKLNGIDTSLPDRLAKYSFTLNEYHLAKRAHFLFDETRSNLCPNIRRHCVL